ncbi:MAG: hypothetical protein SFW36_22660 [Leptolyngbyaceae cyanobacterium bins.59]|nr:hypothetical protein [Leptolyngbyaceae cyanobacterium bins.59]
MNHLPQLTSDATLGDLPLHDFQVHPMTLGQAIADQFEGQPNLPGVIVADDSKILGMISRRAFHERISGRFGPELFLNRPIQTFFEHLGKDDRPLCLEDREKIDVAVRAALGRSFQEMYDPIVVVFCDPSLPAFQAYFLVDFQTLLLAQSQILTTLNQEMRNQRSRLEEEQLKVRDYSRLLERQQSLIQERNRQLETQQLELVKQANAIHQLNRRFLQIGQLLSQEGKQTFQATFTGVNHICQITNQIVGIGELLTGELDTIHGASQVIEKVNSQVRHLAVQAAIISNHGGTELSGFSHITNEISKLVSQTYEVGRQMDRVADRFRSRVQELTESAHSSMVVVRSLVEKIAHTEFLLNELETLVQQQSPKTAATLLLPPPQRNALQPTDVPPENPSMLAQKIALAETTLSELRELLEHRESGMLIKKIRKALKQQSQKPVV